MDMVELMSHLLRCQKDYSGLNAEAAVQRACEIAAEEDNACKGADAAPYHINSSGELVMDLRLSDVLTSMQNMLGLQPSQQESEQQKRPHQSRSATAAKSGLPPGQKCPEFAFPSAPKPSAATWTEAERVAIKSWQLYNWLRAEGEHMGASEKEADDLESSIVQLLAHLLVGE